MEQIKKVLFSGAGNSFYVKDLTKDLHTQYGFVKKEDLKAKDGTVLLTNKGVKLTMISPSFIDVYHKIKRGAQIIVPKEIGAIVAETGINKNSVVVDAGAGSGALACFLGNIVKKVVTYEIRKDFFEIVKENMAFLELDNITIKNKDVALGIDEKEVDVVVFDLPEPWTALQSAKDALKVGGFLVSYSPSIPQVMNFVEAAKKDGFIVLKSTEIIVRDWIIDGQRVRPETKGLLHTGFLTFCRKI